MVSTKQILVAMFATVALLLFMTGAELGFGKVEYFDDGTIGGSDTVIETEYLTVTGIKTVSEDTDPAFTEWTPWGSLKDRIDADDDAGIPEDFRTGLAKMYWTSILAFGLPILLTSSIFSFPASPSRITLNVVRAVTLLLLGLVVLLGYLGTSDLKALLEDEGGEFSWAVGGFLFVGAIVVFVSATVIGFLPTKAKASPAIATRSIRCPRCTRTSTVPVGAPARCGSCGFGG